MGRRESIAAEAAQAVADGNAESYAINTMLWYGEVDMYDRIIALVEAMQNRLKEEKGKMYEMKNTLARLANEP